MCLVTITCWFVSDKRILVGLSSGAVLIGVLTGRIEFIGALALAVTGHFAYGLSRKHQSKYSDAALAVGFLGMSYGLFSHSLPGFNNIVFFEGVKFSELSRPFTMYLNLDKPFVGLFLLIFLGIQRSQSLVDLGGALRTALMVVAPLILTVIPLAWALDYVTWDWKLPTYGWVWMVNNLLVVCVAEETLFRGFVQERLTRFLSFQNGGWVMALLISAVLFGLAHFQGGWPYVVLATWAGLFYGYAYHRTRRIEAAILVHFALNLTHFLFFSYPATA